MPADFVARFSDWKGGDWGVRDSSLADQDQWSGENLTIYPSGLLGPRAGLKALTFTGLPDHTVVPGPMGFAAYKTGLLVVIDKVYRVPMGGGAATAWAAYPSPAITPVRFVYGNGGVVYSLLNGVLYKHNVATSTTAITTPAPLSEVVRWGYWFVGIDRNRPWRLWFSKVDAAGSDFDTWPANNYYDVGNNDPITALQPIFNTLYVGKREGWWSISGVLGTLASIRDVCIGNGPIDPRYTTLTTDNRIVYWPVQNIPAWFNGERVTLETDQVMSPRNLTPFTGDAVIVTPTARRLALAADDGAGGTLMYVWQHGAWMHHRSAYRLGGLAPGEVRVGSELPTNVVYAAQRPVTIGEPVVIASIHHELNRPAHQSDTYASPTDLVGTELIAGHFTTPAWFDPQGRMSRVRWVQVQFRKWASGVANSTNRLRMRVEALGPYGAGSELSEPSVWIEPSERAPTAGADESWRVNIGEQGWGNGFRLHFDVVAGVAVREILAGVNLRTERQ